MLKRKNLILMVLFSFVAHMAIGGTLIYKPFGSHTIVSDAEDGKVIWGVLGETSDGRASSVQRSIPHPEIQDNDIHKTSDFDPPLDGQRIAENSAYASIGTSIAIRPLPVSSTLSSAGDAASEGRNSLIGLRDMSPEESVATLSETGGSDGIGIPAGGRASGNLTEILEEVRREIEKKKYYPPFARRNGIEGVVTINFHIGTDGKPWNIAIGASSGSRILDESALKTLKSIKRFSSAREEIKAMDVSVPIAYKLTEEKNW